MLAEMAIIRHVTITYYLFIGCINVAYAELNDISTVLVRRMPYT